MLFRKPLLAALFLLFAVSPMFATAYYVSPSGSDFFPGNSSLFPWATIAKVNSADLRSGDQVYFLRGGTWREMLVPQASGLYFGAYGTGARPIITGANKVSQVVYQPNGAYWTPAGTNVWVLFLPTIPTQVWFNGVLGSQVNLTQLSNGFYTGYPSTLGLNQWYHDQAYLYVYSTVYPGLITAPSIEATQRNWALQVGNVSSLTVEHLALVNGEYVNALLATGNSGQQVFNDVVFSGAFHEGLSVASGSPSITASEIIDNGSGINVYGGTGFYLFDSIVSGNAYQAINMSAVNGTSNIYYSTITGNSTRSPATPTINNLTGSPLYATSSVLLPNPFEPKIYNYVGLTPSTGNVYQSPYFKTRAAPLIIVPFIDDYINLAVAQAVSQAAQSYGCNISYALNTKLLTSQAWATVAQMQATGVEVVAHTRSHPDLANNNVFSIRYTGTAAKATMTINQTAGLLQTFLNGSTTPDLSLSISDTYNGVIDVLGRIPAGSPYTVAIQPNQNFFTPINLANVTGVDIKTAPYLTQAGSNYLTWEVEGAQADIAANLSGYKAKAFATPYTSSNLVVENHIQNAGFFSNRNGLLNGDSSPDGNWLLSGLDVYNMAAEWLPFAFDATNSASSTGALVEGLGAAGGIMAVYSHGYDEFTLQNWKDLFANLQKLGATCMTMSQANAYVESQGQLLPDGLKKNFVINTPLTPSFSITNVSPLVGANNLQ